MRSYRFKRLNYNDANRYATTRVARAGLSHLLKSQTGWHNHLRGRKRGVACGRSCDHLESPGLAA